MIHCKWTSEQLFCDYEKSSIIQWGCLSTQQPNDDDIVIIDKYLITLGVLAICCIK